MKWDEETSFKSVHNTVSDDVADWWTYNLPWFRSLKLIGLERNDPVADLVNIV